MFSQNNKINDGIGVISSQALKNKYLPSLNGLRGISIILVVMSHLPKYDNDIYLKIFNGHLGVNIFFCLSGFLITTLCIKEKELSGTISLKLFYIRRALRIFPVAYLYLAVLFLINSIFHLDIAKFQFVAAMFYLTNLSYFRSHNFTWFTGHYWSLAVEEQFYLIFPFILKKSSNTFYYVLIFIVFILPVFCALQEFFPRINNSVLYAFTHYFIKFQSISVGCLFSIITFKEGFNNTFFNFIQSYKVPLNILAFFLIFYLGYDDFYSLKAICVNLVISFLTSYIIISNVPINNDIVYKLLNNKQISFIGILSYSIYIWQQIFTSGSDKLPAFLVTLPFNIAFIIITPLLSYFFYEKYFLSLKNKYSILKHA